MLERDDHFFFPILSFKADYNGFNLLFSAVQICLKTFIYSPKPAKIVYWDNILCLPCQGLLEIDGNKLQYEVIIRLPY